MWAETGSDLLRLFLICRKAAKMVARSAEMSVDEVHFLNLINVERVSSVWKLREIVGLTPTRTSKILRSLEHDGYILRSISQSDRRMELVSLTEQGSELADKILTISHDVGKQLFGTPPSSMETIQSRSLDATD